MLRAATIKLNKTKTMKGTCNSNSLFKIYSKYTEAIQTAKFRLTG